MTGFSNIGAYLPKFSDYLKGATVADCLDKMVKKKHGKPLVKFFDSAIKRKEWKTDTSFRNFLEQTTTLGPKLKKLSSENKSKLKKLSHLFHEKVAKKATKAAVAATTIGAALAQSDNAIFASLDKELIRTDLGDEALQGPLKAALKQALAVNVARTQASLKKQANNAIACNTACKTLKNIAQNKTIPSLSQDTIDELLRIANCYETIQTQANAKQTLSPQETMSIAILSQSELPKIEVIKKRVLKGGENWIRKEDFNLSHDLLINQKKKKIYVITKKGLGEGAFKKVVVAVGFTFDKALFKRPKLLAYAATQAAHGVKKVLKNEVAIAKKVKNIGTILSAQYAKVDKTKKGAKMRMITDLCEGDLDLILDKKASKLTKPDKVQLVKDFVGAIVAFHKKGFAHGDIKPGNFLITKEKRGKLADFGAGFPISQENPDPLVGYGTHVYNSPEALTTQKRASHSPAQDDAFALGLTIWELLTKQPLYMKWEKELNSFIKFYESGKDAKAPNAKDLASIESTLKATVEKAILDASGAPNLTAEDNAIIACMKVTASMLKPAKERIDLSTALQEINQITV